MKKSMKMPSASGPAPHNSVVGRAKGCEGVAKGSVTKVTSAPVKTKSTVVK